jgi:DNA repair protein RecN (Recombination protein N)
MEARVLLPDAIEEEKLSLASFQKACSELTEERLRIAIQVAQSVSQRLPSLGMENSRFEVMVNSNHRKCTDRSVYSSESPLGVDDVDFLLIHSAASINSNESVGQVHEMASSGEKARILLAIECSLPGAVGVFNRASDSDFSYSEKWLQLPPVVILYDEIDAHVGGRAAVSIANMLTQQSQSCQIIAITHSPAVAAVADVHVVVEAQLDGANTMTRTVKTVEGIDRRMELARMASGDLASAEAQSFAEALLRNGNRKVNIQQNL